MTESYFGMKAWVDYLGIIHMNGNKYYINRPIEAVDIKNPWHPESEKPTLPFVICTNGEGHYWMGRYIDNNRSWYSCDVDGITYEGQVNCIVAWCDPLEFKPFEKKKYPWTKKEKGHSCLGVELDHGISDDYFGMECFENHEGKLLLTYWDHDASSGALFYTKNCPFCGYKAGKE